MSRAQVTVPLDIPDVRVLKTEINSHGELIITILRYRPKRYPCLECEGHPTTTQRLEWHDPGSLHTFASDEHLLLQLVGSTIEEVSIKERISYDAVLGAMKRRIRASADWSVYTVCCDMGVSPVCLVTPRYGLITVIPREPSSPYASRWQLGS